MRDDSRHDVGGDIIPALVDAGVAHVYDFSENVVPGVTEREHAYWRDVGTVDSYYEAHMDLVSPEPIFNLYNEDWPIYTSPVTAPPAKIVAVAEHGGGEVADSLLSNGVVLSGAYVRGSVLSPRVRVEPGAVVEDCVLLDNVVVGAGAQVRHTVVDKNVVIPEGGVVGKDPDRDVARGLTVSPGAVTVVPKNHVLTEPA